MIVPAGTSVSPASTTRAAPPCRVERGEIALGRRHEPAGAAGLRPLGQQFGGHHRGVGDLRDHLARAHSQRGVEDVGEPVAGRLGGRRAEVGAHRLQALEQRPALRAPPRRQRRDRLAVRLPGQRVRQLEHLRPLRGVAGAQAHLARALAPLLRDLEPPHARDRRRAAEHGRASSVSTAPRRSTRNIRSGSSLTGAGTSRPPSRAGGRPPSAAGRACRRSSRRASRPRSRRCAAPRAMATLVRPSAISCITSISRGVSAASGSSGPAGIEQLGDRLGVERGAALGHPPDGGHEVARRRRRGP